MPVSERFCLIKWSMKILHRSNNLSRTMLWMQDVTWLVLSCLFLLLLDNWLTAAAGSWILNCAKLNGVCRSTTGYAYRHTGNTIIGNTVRNEQRCFSATTKSSDVLCGGDYYHFYTTMRIIYKYNIATEKSNSLYYIMNIIMWYNWTRNQ